VLLATPLAFISTIAALVVVFAGVESIARRRLLSFIGSVLLLVVTVALIVGFVLLFSRHWRTAISVLVGVAALALLAGNLQDMRRR
jgi:energy-coupling factor transporter transmembrane protein EcfT